MILVLNTATIQFSLALLDLAGSIKAEFSLAPGGGHFKELLPSLEYVFKSCNIISKDLEAVVAVQGPGSFTGLRVGLAFVKGLCQSQNIPAIAISSLEAFASQLPRVSSPICPLIASRRGEVFTALYEWDESGVLRCLKAETTLKIEELAGFIKPGTVFIGDHFVRLSQDLQKVFGQAVLLAPTDLWLLRAGAVGRLGLAKYHQKKFTELSLLNPAYLRSPDIRPSGTEHL